MGPDPEVLKSVAPRKGGTGGVWHFVTQKVAEPQDAHVSAGLKCSPMVGSLTKNQKVAGSSPVVSPR